MITAQKIKYGLVFYIIVFIGFQQFPVINVGGSFKIYELLSISLMILNLVLLKSMRLTWLTIFAFGFFVISPIISYLGSILIHDYPFQFYVKYRDSNSFKFNYYIFPILQIIYMFFNFSTVSSLLLTSELYRKDNFAAILKTSIFVGTFISVYSLISLFTIDVIQLLPGWIQNKTHYTWRANGFSQEPGSYVLYQSWICLFIFFSRTLFRKHIWVILILINVISLITTFSSTLTGLILVIFSSVFIFKNSLRVKLSMLFGLLVVVVGLWAFVKFNQLEDYVDAMVTNKLKTFVSAPDNTLSSGAYRSYTGRIGIRIFKNSPVIGVGVGKSIYYMHLYEDNMGIREFGTERLQAGSFPQNLFSIVLSEQGLLGIIPMMAFLIISLRMFWKWRNKTKYHQMFFIGAMFNLLAMFTIAPAYSLFIWVFWSFGLGYIRYSKRVSEDGFLTASLKK